MPATFKCSNEVAIVENIWNSGLKYWIVGVCWAWFFSSWRYLSHFWKKALLTNLQRLVQTVAKSQHWLKGTLLPNNMGKILEGTNNINGRSGIQRLLDLISVNYLHNCGWSALNTSGEQWSSYSCLLRFLYVWQLVG